MTNLQTGAPSKSSLAGQAYQYLYGASAPRQVVSRTVADFLLANLALITGVAFYGVLTGGVTSGSTLQAVLELVATGFVVAWAAFTGTAVVCFTMTRLYRPLPSSRFVKRAGYVGLACGCGCLLHLGLLTLTGGSFSRGVVLPSWTTLFGLAVAIRAVRNYLGAKYRLLPRVASRQPRVEDVLVVGGAGYIGSVLTRQLLDAGYRVRILDLHLFGKGPLQDLENHPRLQVQNGDFRNVEDVTRALRGMDAVVHLGAIVGDPACSVSEETTINVNYLAAKMMAQLTRANGISRFVFASTCSVYGASDSLIDEHSTLNPVSLYATTKIDAERALLENMDEVFQPTILRLATAYGWSHRPRFDLVANLLSAKAITDGEITIFNGEQWRPFVNTRDIARAMVMTLEAPLDRVGGEIFNVGDDTQNHTLRDLGRIVAENVPGTKVNEVRNEEDPRNYRVRFDKIQKTMGFQAKVTLEEGIHEIVAAVKAGAVDDWRDPIYSNVRLMEGPLLKVLSHEEPNEDEMKATNAFLRKAAS